MKIWLIGMMGSGKTSAGQIAAKNLEIPFMDTDQIVEERVGMSVAEFWAENGEREFRELERSVVEDLAGVEGIIATGGGVVLQAPNRRVLAESGLVVWLAAEPSTLVSRLGESSDRPLLAQAEDRADIIGHQLRQRWHLYESVADHRIETKGLKPDEVAREIEAMWTS